MARGIAWTPPHPAAPMDGISFVDCSFLFPFLSAAEYEAALNCLSSLITRRSRAVRANKGDRFDLMFDYLKNSRAKVSEEKFLEHFWWCWNRLQVYITLLSLQEKAGDNIPMPTYFRFLALLAFKIFSAEQVKFTFLCNSLLPSY
ncbi:hypothetical protein BHE74_00004942 [Ensete ventricosum]|nr:hypothetical protein BHE74_00004942 [Ensete ventricosum]